MQYISVASGSSGNCHFISQGSTKILIDAGLSGKKIETNLKSHEEEMKDVKAIFVTHEHSDHIKGVGVLSRRYDIPVYATGGTWRGMEKLIGEVSDKNRHVIETRSTLSIGDLELTSYAVSHDALEPCGFTVTNGRAKISIATDLGYVTDEVGEALMNSDLAVIEANYDDELLSYGSYPYSLKTRIRSDSGHLSNVDAGKLATALVKSGISNIALAHLSRENNRPLLAEQVVRAVMERFGITEKDVRLSILLRDFVSPKYKFE